MSTAVVAAAIRRVLATDPGALFAPVAAHPATEEALVGAHRELADLDDASLDLLAAQSRRAREVVRIHRLVKERLAPAVVRRARPHARRGRRSSTRECRSSASWGRSWCTCPSAFPTPLDAPARRARRARRDRGGRRAHRRGQGRRRGRGRGRPASAARSTALPRSSPRTAPRCAPPPTPTTRFVPWSAASSTRCAPACRSNAWRSWSATTSRTRGCSTTTSRSPTSRTTACRCARSPTPCSGAVCSGCSRCPTTTSGATTCSGSSRRCPRSTAAVGRRPPCTGSASRAMRASCAASTSGTPGCRATPTRSPNRTTIRPAGRSGSAGARTACNGSSPILPATSAPPPASWGELARWSHDLVARWIGSEAMREQWSPFEQEAARRVDAAVDRLGGLDAVESAPTLEVFRRSLALELDAARDRVGRLGEGVLVGSAPLALGVELERLWVCGLAEGVYPAPPADDPLLADADRQALERRAAVASRAHRRAAARAAGRPRGDVGRAHAVLPARRPPPQHRARPVPVPARHRRSGQRSAGVLRRHRAGVVVHARALVRVRPRAHRLPAHPSRARRARRARARPAHRPGSRGGPRRRARAGPPQRRLHPLRRQSLRPRRPPRAAQPRRTPRRCRRRGSRRG